MNSIISVAAGSLFVLIANLFMQLTFIFLAVVYNELAKDYPLLKDISGSFRYLIGIPLFVLIMFVGGIITAYLSKSKALIHCGIVGVLTIVAIIAPLLSNAELTITGGIVSILSIIGVFAGGWYWQRRE